jgi:hypothetical protein
MIVRDPRETTMMRWLKFGLVALLVPLLIAGTLWVDDNRNTPAAVRAYRSNRAALAEIALNPPELKEDERRPLANPLYDAGFVMLRRKGDCICFYHQGFMAAIDSWHEIVYSPKGARGLVAVYEYRALYRLEEVGGDGRWYYVCHD